MSNSASALPDPDANSNGVNLAPAANLPSLTVVPAPPATALVVPALAGSETPERGTPNLSHRAPKSETPNPPPNETPRPRSLLNQGQLAELDLDEHIGQMAQKAEYAALLATRKIPPAFVTDFLADAVTARAVNTVIISTDTSAKEATRHEETCVEKLLTGLRQIQASARQEYQASNPLKLEAYLVGERIEISRQTLIQCGDTLLSLARTERPGGLDDEFLDAVAECYKVYQSADFTQGGEQTDAQKERLKRKAQITSLKQRRQQIQFAAESLWPHRRPENAPIRRAFRLPLKRPYIG